MYSKKVYLTKQGYEILKEELDKLKIKRREISSDIKTAREFGDLSENAEYDAAKEAQALNEKRINELEENLSHAQFIEDLDIPEDEVRIGAKVKLKNLETSDESSYKIVSEIEASLSDKNLSINSPIGKTLLGHKEGDVVEINLPAKIIKYKILKIAR